MVTAKKGDFIEIEYIGRVKMTNHIFDLTKEDVAKKENIYNEKQTYKPLVIPLGHNHLLAGLDKQLEGQEVGKDLEIELKPSEGFGIKNPKMIQTVPLSVFKNQDIHPVPGMQYSMDGAVATIRSVSGGRVIVDFNHPLSGMTLKYEIKINRIVKDKKEKTKALIEFVLKNDNFEIEDKDKKLIIKAKDVDKINDILKDAIKKQIKDLIPELKDKEINFEKLDK